MQGAAVSENPLAPVAPVTCGSFSRQIGCTSLPPVGRHAMRGGGAAQCAAHPAPAKATACDFAAPGRPAAKSGGRTTRQPQPARRPPAARLGPGWAMGLMIPAEPGARQAGAHALVSPPYRVPEALAADAQARAALAQIDAQPRQDAEAAVKTERQRSGRTPPSWASAPCRSLPAGRTRGPNSRQAGCARTTPC